MARRLVIFDIDGTLIDAWGFWTKAYRQMFNQAFGVDIENFRDNYTPGDSIPQTMVSNLLAHGLSMEEIEPKLKLAEAAMVNALGTASPQDVRVLPGVVELLDALRNDGVTLAVVTGNTVAGGSSLLRAAGLIDYFAFLVGSECGSREDKLKEAISRAGKRDSVGYKPGGTYYLDDSLASIPVSRKLGVHPIAVATGETPYNELVSHGAEHVFKDLSDTKSVLNCIGAPHRRG